MTTLNLSMDWGTWINSDDNTIPHGSDTYMRVGSYYTARPIMKFVYTGTPGLILSAKLKIYVSDKGDSPQFQVWRITRESTINATWLDSGLTVWAEAGAENQNNDHYQHPLTATYRILSTGWLEIPITNLTQFQAMLGGLKTILLRTTDPNAHATIEKTPAPYIAIEYKSSLVGGVQII